MTRKFALVCTNNEHWVVGISLHDTREAARKQMRKEFDGELGYDGYAFSYSFGDNSAQVIFSPGEFEYYWSIKEVRI